MLLGTGGGGGGCLWWLVLAIFDTLAKTNHHKTPPVPNSRHPRTLLHGNPPPHENQASRQRPHRPHIPNDSVDTQSQSPSYETWGINSIITWFYKCEYVQTKTSVKFTKPSIVWTKIQCPHKSVPPIRWYNSDTQEKVHTTHGRDKKTLGSVILSE